MVHMLAKPTQPRPIAYVAKLDSGLTMATLSVNCVPSIGTGKQAPGGSSRGGKTNGK